MGGGRTFEACGAVDLWVHQQRLRWLSEVAPTGQSFQYGPGLPGALKFSNVCYARLAPASRVVLAARAAEKTMRQLFEVDRPLVLDFVQLASGRLAGLIVACAERGQHTHQNSLPTCSLLQCVSWL